VRCAGQVKVHGAQEALTPGPSPKTGEGRRKGSEGGESESESGSDPLSRFGRGAGGEGLRGRETGTTRGNVLGAGDVSHRERMRRER